MRLVVDDEGVIWPDLSAKIPGRGAYLCLDEGCLKALSDKRLGILQRDFSPQLPQWEVLQQRMFDMLCQRIQQLLKGMQRCAVIGRDAVMHQMWDKKPLLIMFAADAGEAVLRQVNDAVEKRAQGEMKSAGQTNVVVSMLNAAELGQALGREKVSVVAFTERGSLEKLQQCSIWQQKINCCCQMKRENKVTNG
jgi:predicted RNA-binding protein YlxR (DUF448 family)